MGELTVSSIAGVALVSFVLGAMTGAMIVGWLLAAMLKDGKK